MQLSLSLYILKCLFLSVFILHDHFCNFLLLLFLLLPTNTNVFSSFFLFFIQSPLFSPRLFFQRNIFILHISLSLFTIPLPPPLLPPLDFCVKHHSICFIQYLLRSFSFLHYKFPVYSAFFFLIPLHHFNNFSFPQLLPFSTNSLFQNYYSPPPFPLSPGFSSPPISFPLISFSFPLPPPTPPPAIPLYTIEVFCKLRPREEFFHTNSPTKIKKVSLNAYFPRGVPTLPPFSMLPFLPIGFEVFPIFILLTDGRSLAPSRCFAGVC